MKIAIRADASRTLGLGHVKRCLSLAHALRARGATVRFFTRPVDAKADTDTASSVEVEGFLVSTLSPGAVIDELEDADVFLQRSRSFEPALVLVDHYSLSAHWHRAVRATTSARLAALDDLGDRALDVDVLIDHNLATDHGLKYAGRLAPHTAVLGGPRYALLGPAYADAPRHRAAPWVRSIGVFMGGTDANNLSERALDACRRAGFEGEIEIATTSGNPNIDRLRHAADARAGIRITLDQVDLSAFFARHDLHIGAGGGATWERCCIAAPTLAVLAAANQYPVLLPLQQLGVLELVPSDPPTADDIAKALKPLLADATRRAALSAASRQLVDGHGAGRVADHLLAATSRANT